MVANVKQRLENVPAIEYVVASALGANAIMAGRHSREAAMVFWGEVMEAWTIAWLHASKEAKEEWWAHFNECMDVAVREGAPTPESVQWPE